LNSKNLSGGGIAVDDHADSGDEATYNALQLPGAKRNDDGSRLARVEVLTRQVAFSSTGREWSAVTGEGLIVWGLDEDMIFDPISLTEAITPAAVSSKILDGEYGLALKMALHLNESSLVQNVLDETPYKSISQVVRSVGKEHLERLMQCIARVASESPHIQFYLQWCLQLLQCHGQYIDQHRSTYMRALRATHKAVQTRYDELKPIEQNSYMLGFVEQHAQLVLPVSTMTETPGSAVNGSL
jgi:periodic tryptophan protein 2